MSPKPKSLTPWRDKVEKPQEPRVVDVPTDAKPPFKPGKMIIATPRIIEDIVRKIPRGKLATVSQIMQILCRDFGTDSACPITTGIFLNIVAKAAEEDKACGRTEIVPYWRVLRGKADLNPKFPGGIQAQAEKLEAEGHEIEFRKSSGRVVDPEGKLARM